MPSETPLAFPDSGIPNGRFSLKGLKIGGKGVVLCCGAVQGLMSRRVCSPLGISSIPADVFAGDAYAGHFAIKIHT